ncbi:hypothetical protein [Photobacterium minamisatsumaniensis]|uniref:hypothetical protein n=1 Tax=Photobacterium minamisatsumaniensis TaxID=2910233 RepID=UPI003D0F6D43
MLQAHFRKLVIQLGELTDSQFTHVEMLLKGTDPSSHIIRDLEQRLVDNPECPHCYL